jgi:phosphoenolpyruvate synthase/pyruvate phosphate dikinase
VSVLPLSHGIPGAVEVIGGKASGLAELFALGLPVPPAFVLTADAHDRWRAGGALDAADRDALAAAVAELGEPLAVRSSAVDEDRDARSAAGQYDSVMGVRGVAAAVAAVEHCYREADGGRAEAYRDGAAPARLALVVQREAAADRAGIAFSLDPVTGADDAVIVEAVFGHGEGAVGGTVTPDRYRVDRASLSVSARVADKAALADGRGELSPLAAERRLARTLRDDEARAVAELVLRAERGLGRPVDVEFCLDAGGLWAVQCRPITAVAGRA